MGKKKRKGPTSVEVPMIPPEVEAAGGHELAAWVLWRKMRAWGLSDATLAYCRWVVAGDPGDVGVSTR